MYLIVSSYLKKIFSNIHVEMNINDSMWACGSSPSNPWGFQVWLFYKSFSWLVSPWPPETAQRPGGFLALLQIRALKLSHVQLQQSHCTYLRSPAGASIKEVIVQFPI
jgi:hypothetical protein